MITGYASSLAGLAGAVDTFAQRAAQVAAPQAQPAQTPPQGAAAAQTARAVQGPQSAENTRGDNLTRNLAGAVGDKAAFEANAAVLKANDELTGQLLDILA